MPTATQWLVVSVVSAVTVTWAAGELTDTPSAAVGDQLWLSGSIGQPARPELPIRVLDRTGAELLTQQTVSAVEVVPGADLDATAALLTPVAPEVSAASLHADLDAAHGKAVTAATLPEPDLAPIRDALAALPDVTVLAPQNRLWIVDRDLTSPVLMEMSDQGRRNMAVVAGWAARPPTADGAADTSTSTDVASTIDGRMQRSATQALASVPTPAAMVVLQPSTGDVLAVAQNHAADTQGPIALSGMYPPGSTFKTATVSAALQSGQVGPDSMLACPGVDTIGERRIPNINDFDLGDVPLHTAFAKSCNTTMARLAENLPPNALADAAAQLGLGIDYTAPGMTTVTGSVPVAPTSTLRVEEGIGQGQVTASPFGMALVAASLARGSVPAPAVIAGRPGLPDRPPPPLPPAIADQVKAMMRETVTDGTAARLSDIPELLGKTGTAEYIDDQHAHGWFVGIDGDLALAVLVCDAGSSTPAMDAAGRFLRAMPPPGGGPAR